MGIRLIHMIIDVLKRIYPFEDSDYHVYGKMKTGIFEELIECLSNSKSGET